HFHRLHIEHLRHTGVAFAVLHLSRINGGVRVFALRDLMRAGFCGSEDVALALLSDSHRYFSGSDRRDSINHNHCFGAASRAPKTAITLQYIDLDLTRRAFAKS